MSNSKHSKYACVVFYNDINEDLLIDLSTKVDNIIAVDGAYRDFPHIKPFSTDGSIEIAKKYAKVIEVKEAWETQVDKRNAYIRRVPIGSSFIVIDTDEELCSSFKEGNQNVIIQAVAEGGIEYRMPRVYVRTPGLRYYKTHMTLKDRNGIVDFTKFKDSDVVIKHHLNMRDEQRQKDKEIYRKEHDKRELKDREEIIGGLLDSSGPKAKKHRM
jgi:hypothetical protein